MISKVEKKILSMIRVPSEDDPDKPEFPPQSPRFPATPTIQITVPGFQNVWLKDDSINKYSGTHKDRLAWEVVVLYRDILLAKERGQYTGALPQFSIISSGSAAIAVGRMLRNYGLPSVKVLVDTHIDKEIRDAIENAGCEVFSTDLSAKELDAATILRLTNNPNGFDLTSNRGIALEIGNFDWMSFEIINQSPEYVFIPFGTGTLYKKILEVTKNVVRSPAHDKRYRGNIATLRGCHFMGATTIDADSVADKLYSPFLPFADIGRDWIRFYKTAGYCGDESDIVVVHENFFKEAMTIALEQGIHCEFSGIAGLALLLQMRESVESSKKILIINTGKLRL